MQLYSTRDTNHTSPVDLKTALLQGLAPDGGLFLPETIPTLDPAALTGLSFPEVAQAVATQWFADDVDTSVLQQIALASYTFPVPLHELTPDCSVCELFHGPSQSFKDFAAQFLLRLLDHLLVQDDERVLLLTATSGDTGGAVAAACHGRERITGVILYPKGRISRLQESQIATWGGNVHAIAVKGNFDDCQRLVKEVMGKRIDMTYSHVTSANSINIGRLLPQTFYYWYASLLATGDRRLATTFVIPSGNFGNLTAGVLAQRMGAPIAQFIAATNINDAAVRYLATGTYEPHTTQPTLSNAMDVSDPSNFERLRHLFHDSAEAMAQMVTAVSITDDVTRATMKQTHEQHNYLIDPHTAVALSAVEQLFCGKLATGDRRPVTVLSTAHPAKFPELIHDVTGTTPDLPTPLRACMHRPMHADALADETTEGLLLLLKSYR